MKLETIKKDRKKRIIIGSMIVLSVVVGITFTTTRAKYRSVQSLKLASGTVNYKASDLHLVAIKVSEDGTNYTQASTLPEGNYTLNEEKSKCRIPTSTQTGEDAPIAGGVTIELVNERINVLGLLEKNTKCYLYFDKKDSETIATAFGNIEVKLYSPDFSTIATADEGVYKIADGMYGSYSYYWRGAATTNHVIFDNKCWRIVRINGDKSIRLIYNGTPSGNTCTQETNSAAVIMGSSNAERYYATSTGSYDNPSYAGWTYTLNSQRTPSGSASNAKTQTEKWYNNNISAAAKTKIDQSGKFCGDRDVSTPPSSLGWSSSNYVTSWTAWNSNKSKYFAYAGAKRLYQDYSPTLSCPSEDVYSLAVGAITADEVEFAGGKNENNASYYLNTAHNYWTMSPARWGGSYAWAIVFFVQNDGYLGNAGVGDNAVGLRPVINLRSDVTFNSDSDGTQNNPYIVQ